MNEKQLEKLNKLLELTQNDTITPAQVEQFLTTVLSVIKQSKDNLESLSKEHLAMMQNGVQQIHEYCNAMASSIDVKTQENTTKFDKKIEKIQTLIEDVKLLKQAPGNDGYTPIKGVDYFDGAEGKAGKDGSPDTPEEIVTKLQSLKDEKRLDISAIKGADKLSTKDNLDRAISILDQRTQFLINKQNASTGGGTPGGSTTQLQYNNAGAFGGISGATTDGTSVTYTTGNLKGADIKASSSAGLQILSNAGTVTALFGAGGGANSTFYGGSKFDYATASTIAIFDASKNLISADTATYPSLTELSYVKGVTSAIQTQLNAKESALTFSTGLTRTSNTITNNLSTGVSGGQTVYGGTGSGDNLVLQSTTNATRGNVKIDTTSGGFNFRDYFTNISAMYPGSNTTAGSDGFILASFGSTSMFYGAGGAASLYHFVSGANRTVLTSTYYNIGVNTSIGLALGTSPSSKLEVNTNALGVTQTTSSGIALTNTTAAANNAQQISPALRWSGKGWGTTASTSQAVDFRAFVTPVQSTVPTGYLGFGSSIAGGAYNDGQLVLTSTGNVGIGTTVPTAKLHVAAGTMTDLVPVTTMTGTFPSSMSNGSYGQFISITGAGISNVFSAAMRVLYNAGYTGAGRTSGLSFVNDSGSTGNDLQTTTALATPGGNTGIAGFTTGYTTGSNIGGFAEAGNSSTLNIGFYGKSSSVSNGATNIGALGIGINTGTSSKQIGGYFGLNATTPTFTSAALIADNGAQTSPIFIARDDGSTVFSIIDGGNVGIGTNAPSKTLDVTGDIQMNTAGNGIYIKEGSNATMGTATLVAGTVTVSTTKVTANSRIQLTIQSLGTVTVPTTVAVTARSAGTSFTITSANVVDTSIIAWMIVEPA